MLIAIALAAGALCAVLTLGVRGLATRARLLDSGGAEGHAKALRAVPNVGGIAIVITVVAPILLGLASVRLAPDAITRALDRPDAAALVEGLQAHTPLALGLVACLLGLHAMGLIDDRRALGWRLKLGAMATAAIAMTLGFDVRLLTALDTHVGGSWLSVVITVLWLVAVTNAMNFLDNMDGVTATVGAVSGACFLVAATLSGQVFVGATLALLVGALLGFLAWNRPPASIFMGDGGSLPVGFLLAFLTVRTTYVSDPSGELVNHWHAALMPLCVLAVPLYDLVAVSAIRLSQGRSPFVGDQQHVTHRLRNQGLSNGRILLVLAAAAALTGMSGIVLATSTGITAAVAGLQTPLLLAMLALFEHGRRNKERAS